MKITKGLNPVLRAVGVISAVAIVTGGVTYAALSDSVTYGATTLSTADANLQIYNFGNAAYGDTAPGVTLANLIPGQYSDEQKFYLANESGAPLEVVAKVLPAGLVSNLDDNKDLMLRFTAEEDCADQTTEATLEQLLADGVDLPCNPLDTDAMGNSTVDGTEGNYSVAFKLAEGTDADISGLNLQFTGTVATAPEEVTLP